jgi:hypothetical protein
MSLTDTQIVLLRHAAADPEGFLDIELPRGMARDRAVAALDDLLGAGLMVLRDRVFPDDTPIRHLRITDEGRAALGPRPADG